MLKSARSPRSIRAGALVLRCFASLICAAAMPPRCAANELTISSAQIEALGIALQTLGEAAQLAGSIYPARVILPPQQERVVSAPVAGAIGRVLVHENEWIGKDQPLLELDSSEFGQLQLAALEAANRNRLVRQALSRDQRLFADGVIAERRLLEAEAGAKDAAAALQQAQASLRLAGMPAPQISKLIATGAIQESLLLRSPSAGVLIALQARAGQRVAPADPLVRIANLGRLWLDVQIPAVRAAEDWEHAQISVVGRSLSAAPIGVAALVGEGQTVSLRAEVVAPDGALRPGEFVQVQIALAHAADTWSVPLVSVVRRDAQAYVFVRTPQGFEARAVTVVASADQTLSIAGPLRPGEEIAVSRIAALKSAWLSTGE